MKKIFEISRGDNNDKITFTCVSNNIRMPLNIVYLYEKVVKLVFVAS